MDGKNTALVVDGTGFELNNTDQASGTTALAANGATLARTAGQFASNGQGGAIIDGIGFRNVKRAFDTGAAQNVGLLYTTVNWCVCENSTMDWAFKFHNFQHCEFKYLIAKTNLSGGSGFDFSSNVDGSVLLPGNSTIDEIYNFCTDPRCRGIRFGALAADNCALNEVKTGRIQSNRYGSTSTRSISITATSGNSALAVSASDSAWLKVGMTINFTGTVPTGITANLIYFVTGVDTVANTITISPGNPFSTGTTTPTGSGTYTAKTGGFPSLVIGGNSASLVTACDFGGVDVECTGSTSPIVVSRVRSSKIKVLEQFTAVNGYGVVGRDATLEIEYGAVPAGLNADLDSSSRMHLTQNVAGVRTMSGSVTAQNAYHDSVMINSTSTDYTITVPSGLMRGYSQKAIQNGSGKVIFAAGAGVTISNAVGLKTSGIGAEVKLWSGTCPLKTNDGRTPTKLIPRYGMIGSLEESRLMSYTASSKRTTPALPTALSALIAATIPARFLGNGVMFGSVLKPIGVFIARELSTFRTLPDKILSGEILPAG